jgi:signal transduction histidine kinase
VYVSAGVENGLRFEIADAGPGISQDTFPYIFDPFFTTKPDSVGMGLTRARRMASELGLTVVAENPPDGGTLFIIEEDAEQDDTELLDLAT